MSSRALRRAQRELEERQRLEKLAQRNGHGDQQEIDTDEADDEEEAALAPLAQPKPSLFAMLGNVDDAHEDDDEEAEPDVGDSQQYELAKAEPTTSSKPAQKGKKKKKKGKAKAKDTEPVKKVLAAREDSGLDEIDQALLALNLTTASSGRNADQETSSISAEMQQLYAVLAVDTHHLHAANEMRKLFGRTAVQGSHDNEPRPRHARGQQGGLAAAVAGRNAPGRNLASLALRRNIFIQGKEEWPRATSGGLAMELVDKRSDGSVEYRFVHSMAYQSIQGQFETCVASMDPERMIQLLQFNPYHISTLLQVSEIAKQQRDNATAGELVERALFAFGRAIHSTFANNLAQGKARLDFRRPENREFWLAAWRYINTLGIRATWRTAFEWAKLLLSMAPEADPFCMRLLIDQLALRGREPQALVDIVAADRLERTWRIPPNLAYSTALAHDRLGNPEKARKALRLAIEQYPWIAARLCKELEITPIPKPVWGKEPLGEYQELLCQLYVPRVKDLWNTTQATSLLVEVCFSIDSPIEAQENPYWLADINETDLARYVILSDEQPLLSLLDPHVKSKYTSTSDPLPPDDNITSYATSAPSSQTGRNQAQLLGELQRLRQYFQTIDLGEQMNIEHDLTEDELLRALERAGTSYEQFRRNAERVQLIRMRLQDLGVQVIFQREDRDADRERESEEDSNG